MTLETNVDDSSVRLLECSGAGVALGIKMSSKLDDDSSTTVDDPSSVLLGRITVEAEVTTIVIDVGESLADKICDSRSDPPLIFVFSSEKDISTLDEKPSIPRLKTV